MAAKQLLRVTSGRTRHWVGDGFPVRSLISPQSDGAVLNPFLLLDYAGPEEFGPSETARGVGRHPHRGFETVTMVYQGELEYRDHSGARGTLIPGDVQWMTAASGLVHEELHSETMTRNGGTIELLQLWVNLPAADKMSPPKYQDIASASIPEVALEGDAGLARVIAGELWGVRGPAETFSPITVWDVRLEAGGEVRLPVVGEHCSALVVLRGEVLLCSGERAGTGEVAVFEGPGNSVGCAAELKSHLLVLSAEPIDEPVVVYGPFVMNTQDEVKQAISDYQSGRMGRLQ